MWLRLPRLIRMIGRDALVLWYACHDPATPRVTKLAALLVALYVLSPVDLIPDWLPLAGWPDDATLLAFGLPLLLRSLPGPVQNNAHSAAARLLSRWKFWRA